MWAIERIVFYRDNKTTQKTVSLPKSKYSIPFINKSLSSRMKKRSPMINATITRKTVEKIPTIVFWRIIMKENQWKERLDRTMNLKEKDTCNTYLLFITRCCEFGYAFSRKRNFTSRNWDQYSICVHAIPILHWK